MITVSVHASNTGPVAGAVVVQAYCGFEDSARIRVTRYARMLCSFAKVTLRPMETKEVQLRITLRTLAR